MTEICLHVRRPEQIESGDTKGLGDLPGAPSLRFTRIYVGDEFCPGRLPDGDELRRFYEKSREPGLGLTLLTPVMSDLQLEKAMPLFKTLSDCDGEAEVVANDWGVLSFLKRDFPGFRLAPGRLLNKGHKDPRHRETDAGADSEPILRAGTFDDPGFSDLARRRGIRRLERDLPPDGGHFPAPVSGMNSSVYFPYGCFTAGRVCLTASMSGNRGFIPAGPCGRECEKGPRPLNHPKALLPLMANGNALYYRYSPSTLQGLMKAAEAGEIRLIYQGLSLGGEAAFGSLEKENLPPC